MINVNFMGSWVPMFRQAIEAELNLRNHSPPFTAFHLATVAPLGFPKNRTMVLRGFLFDDPSTNVLTATTDRRSQKYEELEHNDKFEAVFWFERLKKQFRFRGRARIIDETHFPVLDLSRIQPQRMLEDLIQQKERRDQEHRDDEEEEEEDENADGTGRTNLAAPNNGHPSQDPNPITPINLSHSIPENIRSILGVTRCQEETHSDDDDNGLQIKASRPSLGGNPVTDMISALPTTAQQEPLSCALCSPALYHKISVAAGDFSFTNLHDMLQFLYHPPTSEEWREEISRQWGQMLRQLKKGFRKPPPGSPMTNTHYKTIDKIARGVDGKKDDLGLENFAVLALFVERVDLVELDKDRRYVFEKDENHQWLEHEVCP